jgi:hypothetical protein
MQHPPAVMPRMRRIRRRQWWRAPTTVVVVLHRLSRLAVLVVERRWPSTPTRSGRCVPRHHRPAPHNHHCQTAVSIRGNPPPILLHRVARGEEDPIPPHSFVIINLCVVEGIPAPPPFLLPAAILPPPPRSSSSSTND